MFLRTPKDKKAFIRRDDVPPLYLQLTPRRQALISNLSIAQRLILMPMKAPQTPPIIWVSWETLSLSMTPSTISPPT